MTNVIDEPIISHGVTLKHAYITSHNVEPKPPFALSVTALRKIDTELRICLTGRTWHESISQTQVLGTNDAQVLTVGARNEHGLSINANVFLYRSLLFYRPSGRSVREGVERGQMSVTQGQWNAPVVFFRPLLFNWENDAPAWYTNDAKELDNGELETLPILADALQEGGCTDMDLLTDLRTSPIGAPWPVVKRKRKATITA